MLLDVLDVLGFPESCLTSNLNFEVRTRIVLTYYLILERMRSSAGSVPTLRDVCGFRVWGLEARGDECNIGLLIFWGYT